MKAHTQKEKDYIALIEEIRNSKPYDKLILMLRLIHNFSFYEIAKWLNMSRQSSTTTYKRAIHRVVERHEKNSKE